MVPLQALLWFARGAAQSQSTSIRGPRINKFPPIRGAPALMLLRGGVDKEMMSIQWQADP
jgi:hypothetical protein